MANSSIPDEPRFKLRFIICLLASLGAFASTASRVTLTISLVAMIRSPTDSNVTNTLETPSLNPTQSNVTTPITKSPSRYHQVKQLNLTTKVDEQNQKPNKTRTSKFKAVLTESINDRLLEIVFLGGCLSPIPVGRLVEKFGPKLIVMIILFINGLTMSLVPWVSTLSIYVTAFVLFVKGASTGPLYSCGSLLAAHWCPKYEKTMFMGIITAGTFVAIITINPLAGYLCSLDFLDGWPLAFWAMGIFNFLVIGLMFLMLTNDPSEHPLITTAEKEYILKERTTIDEFNDQPVPFGKMLTSGPILAFLLAQFCHNYFESLISYQVPDYFKSILHVTIAQDGFLSGLPYIGSALSLAFFSFIVDKLRAKSRFSTTAIRKIFADLGFISAPAFMIISTFLVKSKWAVILCVCLAQSMVSAQMAGLYSVHLDLAPSFAGTLAGLIETSHNLASMVLNHSAFHLIGDQPTINHWLNLFLLSAILCIIGTHYFALLGSSQLQSWDPTFRSEEKAIQEDQNGDLTYPTIFDPEIFIVDSQSGLIVRKHSIAAINYELNTLQAP